MVVVARVLPRCCLIYWRAFRSLHRDFHIISPGLQTSARVALLGIQLPIMHQPVDLSLRPVTITFDCGG